jgi:hypothetical protein
MLAALVVTACGGKVSNQGNLIEDQNQNIDAYNMNKNQPVPIFDYSQARQNLKEIEVAEARGIQTMSYFFNLGVQNPIMECPSIGGPIPADAALTHNLQTQRDNANPVNNGGGNTVIDQMDPDGFYHGPTTGTWTVCVTASGGSYAFYWEGFVGTGFIASHWDSSQHMIVNDGQPSFGFSKSAAGAHVTVTHHVPPGISTGTGTGG